MCLQHRAANVQHHLHPISSLLDLETVVQLVCSALHHLQYLSIGANNT